jgi:hypothetical protein
MLLKKEGVVVFNASEGHWRLVSDLWSKNPDPNKPFSDHLKWLYSKWLLVGDCVLTPQG